jgi:hypothetical protein
LKEGKINNNKENCEKNEKKMKKSYLGWPTGRSDAGGMKYVPQ